MVKPDPVRAKLAAISQAERQARDTLYEREVHLKRELQEAEAALAPNTSKAKDAKRLAQRQAFLLGEYVLARLKAEGLPIASFRIGDVGLDTWAQTDEQRKALGLPPLPKP